MSWQLAFITSNLAGHFEYLKDMSAFSRLSETKGGLDEAAGHPREPQSIEFLDVCFSYPGHDALILKNLNFTIKAGKHYAFVGVNGAGKTTITKLLTGLYDNYTGQIMIDGIDIKNFTQAELKAMFAIVYQDFATYQIPIIDSILLGKRQDDFQSKLDEILNMLELHELIGKLPDGLDTPLGRVLNHSVDLSGGEWQKIAIARSAMQSNPVKILDEPTAALDPIAESRLYASFDRISKGRTAVFITHRLGAARLADEIIVVHDGGAAEIGSHDELMQKGGLYYDMFEAQKGWYV